MVSCCTSCSVIRLTCASQRYVQFVLEFSVLHTSSWGPQTYELIRRIGQRTHICWVHICRVHKYRVVHTSSWGPQIYECTRRIGQRTHICWEHVRRVHICRVHNFRVEPHWVEGHKFINVYIGLANVHTCVEYTFVDCTFVEYTNVG
jgi:hypothetical protein